MNQAPPPPTPEQLAAQLDEQIAETQQTIATLPGEISQHRAEADRADMSAEEADRRRSEVTAHTAALGVNALVTASEALRNGSQARHTTAATRYRVDHSEGQRQEAERRDMTAQGRRKIWAESLRPAQDSHVGQGRIDHRQYEDRRARALGMHENHRPWGRIDRLFSGLGRLAQGGRFRQVDPYNAQIEHDHNGVVTVNDAMALTAHRVANEVHHSIYGRPALPDFVQARRAAAERTRLERFVVDDYGQPTPALLAESGTTLGQALTVAQRVQMARERLTNQDAGLAHEGRILHLLAFGARTPAEIDALSREARDIRARIGQLRDPSLSAQDIDRNISDNEAALDNGIDFTRFADSLGVANRHTLTRAAELRQEQATVQARLADPNLDPADEPYLRREATRIQHERERVNGRELTLLEDQIRRDEPRRTRDLADIDHDLTLERQRLARAEADIDTARAAKDDTALQAAKAERDRARQEIDTLNNDLQQVNEPIRIRNRIYARRNEIVELDNRDHQIDVALNGGITDPNERQEVMDEFSRVAMRQIDVIARRALFDAYQPASNEDVLGQQVRATTAQYEQGMRLLYPPQGRRSEAEVRSFLGDERYRQIIDEAEQAAASSKNGSRAQREQALIAKGIQDALNDRVNELNRAHNRITQAIHVRANKQDPLLESERVQLPLLIGAVAANPTLLRDEVVTEEQERARQERIAQEQLTQAQDKRRRLAQARADLPRLQAQRRAIPHP